MSKKDRLKEGVSCILSARTAQGGGAPETVGASAGEAAVEKQPHRAAPGGGERYERRGRPRKGERSDWNAEKTITTTFVFDEEQYNRVLEVAYRERLSRKSAMRMIIELGLAQIEDGN